MCFPIDIPLFMFASTSADFQKGHQSFAETEWEITPQEITEKTKTVGMQTNCSSLARTDQTFMSGCRSELMRFTIQLNRRPYNALDMASRTSAALSTVLERMMVSPLVTTHWEVSASWSSSGPMLRRDAAEKKGETVNQFHSEEITASYHNTIITNYNMVILQIFKVESGKVPFSQILQHHLKSTAQWSQTHI